MYARTKEVSRTYPPLDTRRENNSVICLQLARSLFLTNQGIESSPYCDIYPLLSLLLNTHEAYLLFSVPSEPLKVNGFSDSSTELNITWNEPRKFNGVLTQYTVYFKLVRDDNNVTKTAEMESSVIVGIGQTTVILDKLGKQRFFNSDIVYIKLYLIITIVCDNHYWLSKRV